MKARKFVMLMASVGLVFGLMTGCGGGGGDTPTAGLDPEKVNDFVGEISDGVGCTYTTVATAQIESNKLVDTALSFKTVKVMKNVIVSEDVLKHVLEASRSAKTTEEINGTCGGDMVIETDESETSMSVDITFNHYCNSEAVGVDTTLNGSLGILLSQTSETSMTITASTPTPINVKTTNPNTEEKMDGTIELQGGQVAINLDSTTSELTTVVISASLIKLTDHVTQKILTITNLSANVDMVDESVTFSAGLDYTDFDGRVDVSGSASADSEGIVQGTVILTDANGKKATIKSTSVEDVFDVSFDNAPLGKMDCSMVEVPELPEL